MIKNILRTIAMMYVSIDNSDFFDSINTAQILHHHRFDINSAKTADSVNYTHCMMPRRPD